MRNLKTGKSKIEIIIRKEFSDGFLTIYSDGYCEQIGRLSVNGWKYVTLRIPFTNMNYHVNGQYEENTGDYSTCSVPTATKTVNGFYLSATWNGASYGGYVTYEAKGFVDLNSSKVQEYINGSA